MEARLPLKATILLALQRNLEALDRLVYAATGSVAPK